MITTLLRDIELHSSKLLFAQKQNRLQQPVQQRVWPGACLQGCSVTGMKLLTCRLCVLCQSWGYLLGLQDLHTAMGMVLLSPTVCSQLLSRILRGFVFIIVLSIVYYAFFFYNARGLIWQKLHKNAKMQLSRIFKITHKIRENRERQNSNTILQAEKQMDSTEVISRLEKVEFYTTI